MVWSNRFWMAPRSARWVETDLMALSRALMASEAPLAAVTVVSLILAVRAVERRDYVLEQ